MEANEAGEGTVITLGPAGTYSHRAAQSLDAEVVFADSVHEIAAAVVEGDHARGVIPIENSIEGSVTESLDVLAEQDVAVVREIVTPVRHALLAQDEEFTTVASHPQALAQCRGYLDAEYPNVSTEAVASTAKSVEHARENSEVAAIAHPDTAGKGDGDDMRVLATDIQDRTSNATRFVVVAPASERSEAGGKSSLLVYPNTNHPGLLLSLLEPFADHDINLTRIESRPSGERLGDYVFHVDFEAGLYEERANAAVEEVERIAENGWVRWLGSYDTQHVVE